MEIPVEWNWNSPGEGQLNIYRLDHSLLSSWYSLMVRQAREEMQSYSGCTEVARGPENPPDEDTPCGLCPRVNAARRVHAHVPKGHCSVVFSHSAEYSCHGGCRGQQCGGPCCGDVGRGDGGSNMGGAVVVCTFISCACARGGDGLLVPPQGEIETVGCECVIVTVLAVWIREPSS